LQGKRLKVIHNLFCIVSKKSLTSLPFYAIEALLVSHCTSSTYERGRPPP